MVVPSLLERDCCLAKVVLLLRATLHLCFVHQGRYLAFSLQRTALHSICTVAAMAFNTILLPSDDLGVVRGNVCLDVGAGGVAHLDLLGVEDCVEWRGWREVLPDQTKKLASYIGSDIGRPWRIKPNDAPLALLLSPLHPLLDVVHKGQLVSVARLLYRSLVVFDFLVEL